MTNTCVEILSVPVNLVLQSINLRSRVVTKTVHHFDSKQSIGMKSMTEACSDMSGLHLGHASSRSVPEYTIYSHQNISSFELLQCERFYIDIRVYPYWHCFSGYYYEEDINGLKVILQTEVILR